MPGTYPFFIYWQKTACRHYWHARPRWWGQQGHFEGIRTSGTLCEHQEWYFWGEWALGKVNLLYRWFELILTTVYLNIPNCKWSAIYGCLPQHMSLKLLVRFFGLLFNKQDWQTWSSTLNQNQVLPLSGERYWSSARATWPVLGRSYDELLCEIQDEAEGHTAPHSTLTSDHAIETLGEREAGIYTPPRSALGKSRRIQPWARVPSTPIFYIISFHPVATDPPGSVYLCSPSRPPRSYSTPTTQVSF